VADFYVGEGALAGRGVYAARRFVEGEVVVPYRLRRLSRDEFRALPGEERPFVHSYWGERHLYPEPARYVNHSATPNCIQDFERGCDIALRTIEPDEAITIDATEETDRELATFLAAYQAAVDAGDAAALSRLVDEGAVLWSPGREAGTKRELVEDLRPRTVRGVRWMIGTGRWEAVCSYDIELGGRDGPTTGHVTDVVAVVEGNWQLVYRHVSHP
jgi:hypothetical protein